MKNTIDAYQKRKSLYRVPLGKKEMQEYLISKQTVEHILGIDLEETRGAKEENIEYRNR